MMQNETNKTTITINSYQNIWSYEKQLYTLFDMELPAPIGVKEFSTFAIAEVLIISIRVLLHIPLFGPPDLILVHGALPYALARVMKFLPFDGKKPVRYLTDYAKFYLRKESDIEFFRPVLPEADIKLDWKCPYRRRYTVKNKKR